MEFFIAMTALGLYFMPALIANSRKHRNASAIFVTNLLIGWTGLGWIIAMIWAFTDNRKQP